MDYFIKTTTEETETTNFLLQNPLCLAVLFECSRRARRKEEVCRITGLNQYEFFISETEFKKFGLKKTQSGKLRRTIKTLVDLKIIEKIESKTGSNQCSVYRLIDLSIFMPHFENREQNREQIESRQRADREQIETKEEGKKEKKEKNEIYSRIISFLNSTCSKNYKDNSKETREKINGRMAEGFKEEDFYKVIKNKSKEWKGTNMDKYLRPETLFAPSKFESYLNESEVKKTMKEYMEEFRQCGGFGGFRRKYLEEYGENYDDIQKGTSKASELAKEVEWQISLTNTNNA